MRAVATRGAAASQTHVAEVARGVLGYGNAVDGVLAGVLVAAAECPSVLFGPLQLLVGGAGAGLLAIDGRVRQPGLGVPRPRGFFAAETVPLSALVAVPALPAAIVAAGAVLGSISVARAAGPAIELARASSPERAALIERLVRRGAQGLAEEDVAGELMAAAGRPARGLLTREDLSSVVPAVVQCRESDASSAGVITTPWRGDARGDSSSTQVVAACDGQGLAAVACYEAPVEGLSIPALGIVAPLLARPVLRGFPRVRPGDPRPASSPIALRIRAGWIDLAIGIAEARDAEELLDEMVRLLGETLALTGAPRPAGQGCLVALVRTRNAARVVASA
ncbi:MAG: hypothetical protein ACLP1X_30215 [Polyangiaceae bacterium]